MTGTSIIMPDAAPAQSSIIASQWCPEGIAPSLLGEYVFDGGQAASLINHANPPVLPTLIGAPTFNAHSMSTASNAQGIETGLIPSQSDQTFVAVMKTPTTSAGGIFACLETGFTGILWGVDSGKFAFYNSISGASGTAVGEVVPVAGGNFFFLIGWGSIGGPGSIRTASAGALNTTNTGLSNSNVSRPATNTLKIGGAVNANPGFEIAYAARVPMILTDAQQLAWYLALKSALGVTVA